MRYDEQFLDFIYLFTNTYKTMDEGQKTLDAIASDEEEKEIIKARVAKLLSQGILSDSEYDYQLF